MKRLAVVCLAALVLAGPAVTSAHALSPAASSWCRNKIINEWEGTGRIKTTYPVACYKVALAFVKKQADLRTYSSIADDIRAALLAREARAAGKTAPSFVGKGVKTSHTTTSATGIVGPGGSNGGGGKGHKGGSKGPGGGGSNGSGGGGSEQASNTSSGGSSGTPLPVIILGAIAILLVAAGAIGTGVRYQRRRGATQP